MIYVNATIHYRGTKPTEEYIHELEKQCRILRFVGDVTLEEITSTSFTYFSDFVSHLFCPGNPELSDQDKLYCSYVSTDVPINFKWDMRLWRGYHIITCPKGDYQVLTYTKSSWISWVYHKYIKKSQVKAKRRAFRGTPLCAYINYFYLKFHILLKLMDFLSFCS